MNWKLWMPSPVHMMSLCTIELIWWKSKGEQLERSCKSAGQIYYMLWWWWAVWRYCSKSSNGLPDADPAKACWFSKKYSAVLQYRLHHWTGGNFQELLNECRTIQSELNRHHSKQAKGSQNVDNGRCFASLVNGGKLSSAMRLLCEPSSGVLKLDDTFEDKLVSQILDEKHPKPGPPSPDVLLSGTLPPRPHPVKFSGLDLRIIRRAALNTYGAAGPFGVDAKGWRWMCISFSDASDSLCDALASSARRLATQYIDPN